MKKSVLPVMILLLLLSSQLMAQSELKTQSVSVFKDGKSFVIKEGKVATTNRVFTLREIPGALFGTLWFVGKQADVVQVTSKQETVDEPVERKVSTFADLLFANKGKLLTITTHDDKTYTGTVEDFELPENTNSIVHLKTSDKWISISPSSVKAVEFANQPEKVAKTITKVKKPLIKVQFTKEGTQQLSMMYLQNGITWTPTYLLELVSDTEARLRLQVEVSNDGEDIIDTNMNFVVGVPNFRFANRPATLTSFVEQLYREVNNYGDNRSNMFSNAIQAQVMDYSEQVISINERVDNVEAEASEDFYFYPVKGVSLEKGGRAHYPLFHVPVVIKHLYECNLSLMQNESYYRSHYNSGSSFTFDTKRCNVFHSIEIKNDSNNPFTTGPVMIVEEKTQRPLVQDLIKYTGIGQKSSVQLTQSPDIRVEEQEKIIESKRYARKWNNSDYYLLTIEGEVTITNSKKKDVEMAISKLINGEIKSASIKYDHWSTAPVSGNINPSDRIKFNPTIKAGQTFKFTYTYQMYVRD